MLIELERQRIFRTPNARHNHRTPDAAVPPRPPLLAFGAPAQRRGGAFPFVVGPSFPGHCAMRGWGYADKALGGGAVAATSAAAGEGQLEAGAR